jgi:hypothetical protein
LRSIKGGKNKMIDLTTNTINRLFFEQTKRYSCSPGRRGINTKGGRMGLATKVISKSPSFDFQKELGIKRCD